MADTFYLSGPAGWECFKQEDSDALDERFISISRFTDIDRFAYIGDRVKIEARVSIAAQVVIQEGTRIDECASLADDVRIGYRCHIGPHATLHEGAHIGNDCIIQRNVNIGQGAVIGEHVIIGNNAVIGPGARIHDHVYIEDDARIEANGIVYHQHAPKPEPQESSHGFSPDTYELATLIDRYLPTEGGNLFEATMIALAHTHINRPNADYFGQYSSNVEALEAYAAHVLGLDTWPDTFPLDHEAMGQRVWDHFRYYRDRYFIIP